jgi:hypothetical protein
MMMSKGLTVFTLDEQNQFHLQGTELTVKELRLVKDENPSTTYLEIMAESDKDGEEFEYPLTDDSTTQLDQIELLTILEKI